MNRRERRERKIAHEKRMRGNQITKLVIDPHWNLFDEIHGKSKFPVKVNSIYESVFCKGEKT